MNLIKLIWVCIISFIIMWAAVSGIMDLAHKGSTYSKIRIVMSCIICLSILVLSTELFTASIKAGWKIYKEEHKPAIDIKVGDVYAYIDSSGSPTPFSTQNLHVHKVLSIENGYINLLTEDYQVRLGKVTKGSYCRTSSGGIDSMVGKTKCGDFNECLKTLGVDPVSYKVNKRECKLAVEDNGKVGECYAWQDTENYSRDGIYFCIDKVTLDNVGNKSYTGKEIQLTSNVDNELSVLIVTYDKTIPSPSLSKYMERIDSIEFMSVYKVASLAKDGSLVLSTPVCGEKDYYPCKDIGK